MDSDAIAPSAEQQHDWGSIVLLPNPLPNFARNAVDTSLRVFDRELSLPLLLQINNADELAAIRLVARSQRHSAYLFNVGDLASMLSDRSALSRLVTICDAFEPSTLLAEIPVSRLIDTAGRGWTSIAALTSIVENLRLSGLILRLDFHEAARNGQDDVDPSLTLELVAELRPIIACPILVRAESGLPRSIARRLRESGTAGFVTGGSSETISERIPPAAAIRMLRGLGVPVIADAIYISGAHAAKAIALGADLIAPRGVLTAGHVRKSEDLDRWIDGFASELEETMFASGTRMLADLRQAPFVATGQTREWLEAAETLWRGDSGSD